MATKIIYFLTLLAYSMIVSQSFMYILSLKNAQLQLGVNAYIELRKLIDASMRANFKYVIYSALLANILLIVLTARNPGSLAFITATIALIALIADIMITLKGNMPINDIINAWSSDHYPANWTDYRAKWLQFFQYRQIASIIGFTGLLIGAVFGSK